MIPNLNSKTRKQIYNAAQAVLPLLITLGLVSETVAGKALGVLGVLLGYAVPALAKKNVNEEE